MLWKTHISISNQVLRTIGINLSDEVYSKYKAGIIAPDQWQDFPHHYGKSNDITKYLLYARQSYLQDNLEDTFYYLGVAMHYIQDSYTSVISYRSQSNQIWHHNYEQSIEDSPFVEDLQKTIQYYFRDDYSQLNKYSKIALTLSGKIEGKIILCTLQR